MRRQELLHEAGLSLAKPREQLEELQQPASVPPGALHDDDTGTVGFGLIGLTESAKCTVCQGIGHGARRHGAADVAEHGAEEIHGHARGDGRAQLTRGVSP